MRRVLMTVVLVLAARGDAADKKVSAREELARLEKELAAQRSLMVRMLELQNECTTQMIRAAKGEEVQTPVLAEPPPPVASPTAVVSPPPAAPIARLPAPERVVPPVAHVVKTANLTGRVHVTTGGPAWVFVEDVSGAVPGPEVEIKQQDKQFNPRLVAVSRGTRVAFPNLDVVYHNVFSLTPGQSFDLGMVRAGDPVKSKVMTRPGVVEIFCNLHSRMSAAVLVAPGPLLTKVAHDGTFTLENVPVGTHRVSAWAGGQALSTQTVEVGPGGGTAQFELSPAMEGAHTNKVGQPYGSYAD